MPTPTPNYVATKSAWACVSFLWIVACILIIPLIILIFRIISIKHYRIEFYDDKVIVKSGWLNTNTRQMTFAGVTAVGVNQTLWGKIFGYGNVWVDCVGKWDLSTTTYIKNPAALEEYLQTKIIKIDPTQQHVRI